MSGAFERYGLTMEELAVVSSSHYAEERHIRAVKNILSKCGVSEDSLKCGEMYSMNDEIKS